MSAAFVEHMEELRRRLARSVIYVIVATGAAWVWREDLLAILRYPVEAGAEMAGIEGFTFRVFELGGGLLLMAETSLVAGAILALPLVLFEAWLFLEPALTAYERRYVVVILPAATALFLGGVAFCYAIAPQAFGFYLKFNESIGVQLELTLQPYLYLLVRMLLVFGLVFEMPLALMFLTSVGVVTHRQLLGWWRHAVVVIFIVLAAATPRGDWVMMTLMAGPVILFYLVSALLCGVVEKRREQVPEPGGGDW